MGTRQLLFVTYHDENLVDGFSYAAELAKAMREGITLLLVEKNRSLTDRLDDLMTAMTFAEAGEHDTARAEMSRSPEAVVRSTRSLRSLLDRCTRDGVSVSVEQTDLDVVSAIRAHLENGSGIDKIVLSPGVTEAGDVTAKQLSRLVRTSSRPIVTITRRAAAAGA
jgi:hypothetical protein